MIPNNACTLCITAAAGTELAGASFEGTVTPQGYSPQGLSSPPTELYDPKAFITHAALLRQAFAHCAIVPTAASRRSLDRVSVPVWRAVLSDPLRIVALVGRYPTNQLIRRTPLPAHPRGLSPPPRTRVALCGLNRPFGRDEIAFLNRGGG